MAKTKVLMVPFQDNYKRPGELIAMHKIPDAHYEKQTGVVWKENFEFEETLTSHKCAYSRDSKNLIFLDSKGNWAPMFPTDFDDFMERKGFEGNKVTGIWTYNKIGKGIGIKFVR